MGAPAKATSDVATTAVSTEVLNTAAARFTPTGLVLADVMAFDDWAGIGSTLYMIREGLNWSLGDWINYGEARYGEKYSQMVDETGRSADTLMNIAWVASSIPIEDRRETLSWSHHAEVAGMDAKLRNRWLDQAERLGWSKSELRKQIRDAKKITPAPKPTAAPDATPAATPAPAPEPGDNLPPAGDSEPDQPAAPGEADLLAELESADAEIARLEALVKSLEREDRAAEILSWSKRYAQLQAHVDSLTVEANEAKKQAAYQTKILKKIREALGVERTSQIVKAITARFA